MNALEEARAALDLQDNSEMAEEPVSFVLAKALRALIEEHENALATIAADVEYIDRMDTEISRLEIAIRGVRDALVAAFDELLTLYGTTEYPGPEELADTALKVTS
jgi:HAMP domain-containing protein